MRMIHISEYSIHQISGDKRKYTDLYVSMDNIAGIDCRCGSLPEVYFKYPISGIVGIELTKEIFEKELKPKFKYFS